MLIAWVPVLAVVIGLPIWFVAANPKVAEAGRMTFGAGLIVTLFVLARVVVKLG